MLHIRWVEFVKCMRNASIPIETLIEYVSLFQQGNATKEARKQILIDQREQLIARMEQIQKSINLLNLKIERYEQLVVPAEEALKKDSAT